MRDQGSRLSSPPLNPLRKSSDISQLSQISTGDNSSKKNWERVDKDATSGKKQRDESVHEEVFGEIKLRMRLMSGDYTISPSQNSTTMKPLNMTMNVRLFPPVTKTETGSIKNVKCDKQRGATLEEIESSLEEGSRLHRKVSTCQKLAPLSPLSPRKGDGEDLLDFEEEDDLECEIYTKQHTHHDWSDLSISHRKVVKK